MSYTYLASSPFSSQPTIVMTTNPSSRKTLNLQANPRVSLLVHDWVSHRPPTRTRDNERNGSPPPAATRSSLASLLASINTSALSSISTTIVGRARFMERGSEEEKWYKARHLENNTFASDERDRVGVIAAPGRGNDQEAEVDESARVVVVDVREGRIADWKGGVMDWAVVSHNQDTPRSTQMNGVS